LGRAAIIGGVGALLHALSTVGTIILFTIGCSCSCPPVTNTIVWLTTVLMLFPLTIAAVFASSAFTSENPFSLKNHWSSAVTAAVGFLIAGGGLISASVTLLGRMLSQAVGLVCGATLLALASPVALSGRARLGAALGAVGAALIGLSGLFPIIPVHAMFGVRITWETLVAALLQVSIVGHPFVMFSVSAVLTLLVIGAPKRVVAASASIPTAILAVLSFNTVEVLVAGIIRHYNLVSSYFESVPGSLIASTAIFASLILVGPVLLGIAGVIATAAIALKLVR